MTGSGVWLQQALVQIVPSRIHRLNQGHFFCPRPGLELLFTADRVQHGRVQFKINQRVNAVLLGETRRQIILVLPDALNQVGRHADIQRATRLTGQNIDGGLHWLWVGGVDGTARHGLPRYARNDGHERSPSPTAANLQDF